MPEDPNYAELLEPLAAIAAELQPFLGIIRSSA
jgi:hypothetical protein